MTIPDSNARPDTLDRHSAGKFFSENQADKKAEELIKQGYRGVYVRYDGYKNIYSVEYCFTPDEKKLKKKCDQCSDGHGFCIYY